MDAADILYRMDKEGERNMETMTAIEKMACLVEAQSKRVSNLIAESRIIQLEVAEMRRELETLRHAQSK